MKGLSAPFSPPSTPGQTVEELRNLHRALGRLSEIKQLTESATSDEVRAKINEVVALLAEITRGGDVARR